MYVVKYSLNQLDIARYKPHNIKIHNIKPKIVLYCLRGSKYKIIPIICVAPVVVKIKVINTIKQKITKFINQFLLYLPILAELI